MFLLKLSPFLGQKLRRVWRWLKVMYVGRTLSFEPTTWTFLFCNSLSCENLIEFFRGNIIERKRTFHNFLERFTMSSKKHALSCFMGIHLNWLVFLFSFLIFGLNTYLTHLLFAFSLYTILDFSIVSL